MLEERIDESLFLYRNDNKKIALLYDLNTSKQYQLPYNKTLDLNNKTISTINTCCSIPNEKKQTKLEHLRLVLTNKCNLNCIYCYANGGSYNQDLQDMDFSTIKNTLDFFYSKFEWIHQISFFGGEPLIRADLIDLTCKYVTDYCDKNNIKYPIFSMVTNGILLNENERNIINKHNIHINISLDGPKDFNDKQRIFKNKKSTLSVFDIVDKNAKLLRESRPFSIESTCTNIINDFEYTFKDIESFFQDRYSIKRVNVSPAMMNENVNHNLDIIGDKSSEKILSTIINRFFQNNEDKFLFNDIIIRLLNTFFSNFYCSTFCDAGITQFTVSMNGDVYPCQLFLNKKEFVLGNINDINQEQLNSFKKKYEKNFSKCKACGYKRFCQTCLNNVTKISNEDAYCQELKKGINIFLQNMFDLKTNDIERYTLLLNSFREYYAENQ